MKHIYLIYIVFIILHLAEWAPFFVLSFIYREISQQLRRWGSYQSIKHKSVKSFTVWVLHHNVEESIQCVLQKLNTHTHTHKQTDYNRKRTHRAGYAAIVKRWSKNSSGIQKVTLINYMKSVLRSSKMIFRPFPLLIDWFKINKLIDLI